MLEPSRHLAAFAPPASRTPTPRRPLRRIRPPPARACPARWPAPCPSPARSSPRLPRGGARARAGAPPEMSPQGGCDEEHVTAILRCTACSLTQRTLSPGNSPAATKPVHGNGRSKFAFETSARRPDCMGWGGRPVDLTLVRHRHRLIAHGCRRPAPPEDYAQQQHEGGGIAAKEKPEAHQGAEETPAEA